MKDLHQLIGEIVLQTNKDLVIDILFRENQRLRSSAMQPAATKTIAGASFDTDEPISVDIAKIMTTHEQVESFLGATNAAMEKVLNLGE